VQGVFIGLNADDEVGSDHEVPEYNNEQERTVVCMPQIAGKFLTCNSYADALAEALFLGWFACQSAWACWEAST